MIFSMASRQGDRKRSGFAPSTCMLQVTLARTAAIVTHFFSRPDPQPGKPNGRTGEASARESRLALLWQNRRKMAKARPRSPAKAG